MIRTDIAALIAAGHSDEHIARRLGCHRATVNRHRNRLARPVTADERLLAEELPARVRDFDRRRQPISPAQAAANRRALAAALRAA
ncbi:helix-turn-helix domain-containing protein [Streptomyces sp. DH37]|uniref:helix-turn-helix domain-containing protein n=1 Tax=Streptomyces sp. DH37 TaxID=3040122 RepID=UPI0024434309|nr:helix-turn-helix domain-containing protein [Streptomyces sp. DH37]MDG9701708.1 helix-turn-helix domain-containing protein [Streptomyces sp. DH37]